MARREIGRRQLLVLIDVPCCDPSLQHRRIADRCRRHLCLRDRPHDEEVLRGDRAPGSSLQDQPFRDENRPELRRARLAPVEDEERRDRSERDPQEERNAHPEGDSIGELCAHRLSDVQIAES